jgi:diketogulonate reductase-like aldo/keto reductase
MPADRFRRLADGRRIPSLGFGTWQIPEGPAVVTAVRQALEAGYRHIDTAQGYGNEAGVGRALRESGLPRDEVFITTKLDPARRDPVAEAERSLERLGIEQLDLYLVHFPLGGPTRHWRGMERAHARGLTRSIGVSNFGVGDLDAVTAFAEVAPVVDQVQLSPFQHRRDLLARCDEPGIVVEAYSPLTRGEDLDDPTLARVASACGRTPAQVLLRWALQHGLVVLPKSVHRDRIIENSQVHDFSLSDADMDLLDGLDRTGGSGEALENKWWTLQGRLRARVWSLRQRLRD